MAVVKALRAAAQRLQNLSAVLEGWDYGSSTVSLAFRRLCNMSEEMCAEFRNCEVEARAFVFCSELTRDPSACLH